MTEPKTAPLSPEIVRGAVRAVEGLSRRYEIAALEELLDSCRRFARTDTLNVAVFGRFKAGKSSFLNHLLGRPLLPVGVVPVTSVVTEIEYGPQEQAEIRFGDGRREPVRLERIGEFIAESENPGNLKQVARVRIALPDMDRYRGIRFVDTPGLDSVLERNTEASLAWLPQVGLALVAVGVDPPLSRHDVELIRNLSRHTPNISLLLTKVDLLGESERVEVQDFVRRQLAGHGNAAISVYPYSVRPGFEHLRSEFEDGLLSRTQAEAGERRAAILRHKLDSLLSECAGYLSIALKAAEAADSGREELRCRILGRNASLDDARLALELTVRHAAGATRSSFETLLRNEEPPVRKKLQAGLEREFPSWKGGLGVVTDRFDDWLRGVLNDEITELSRKHREEFLQPVQCVSRQLSHSLQDFRNRLSERTLAALGVPLRTTEIELHIEDPRSPDVRVGRIFDHDWQLLAWLIPMALVRSAVRKHFRRKAGELVSTNLSRLTSQWEEIVNAALLALGKETARRLAGLIATIEKLLASAGRQVPQIQEDLHEVEQWRSRLKRAPQDGLKPAAG